MCLTEHFYHLTHGLARKFFLLPALDYWDTPAAVAPKVIHKSTAIVAGIQSLEGEFQGVHCTWICYDGSGKVALYDSAGSPLPAKKIKGSMDGGAIRLTSPAESMLSGERYDPAFSAFEFLKAIRARSHKKRRSKYILIGVLWWTM